MICNDYWSYGLRDTPFAQIRFPSIPSWIPGQCIDYDRSDTMNAGLLCHVTWGSTVRSCSHFSILLSDPKLGWRNWILKASLRKILDLNPLVTFQKYLNPDTDVCPSLGSCLSLGSQLLPDQVVNLNAIRTCLKPNNFSFVNSSQAHPVTNKSIKKIPRV